jgi:hypothetical protein
MNGCAQNILSLLLDWLNIRFNVVIFLQNLFARCLLFELGVFHPVSNCQFLPILCFVAALKLVVDRSQ